MSLELAPSPSSLMELESLLSDNSLNATVDADNMDQPLLKANAKGFSRFTFFSIFVCILCTSFNLWALASNTKHNLKVARYQDLANLRRPNQWIGLDRVEEANDIPASVLLYPNLLSQINEAKPNLVYSDDLVRFRMLGGLVPPDDKQFIVTSKISSIVEFRAIDFKMEHCELAVTLPLSIDPYPNITLSGRENVVEVWKVSSQYPLNGRTLSYNTRPARVDRVDTILISLGLNYTYPFPCPSDSLHTFEFSAGNDATHVNWTQDHKSPTPGVVLWQHSSSKE